MSLFRTLFACLLIMMLAVTGCGEGPGDDDDSSIGDDDDAVEETTLLSRTSETNFLYAYLGALGAARRAWLAISEIRMRTTDTDIAWQHIRSVYPEIRWV